MILLIFLYFSAVHLLKLFRGQEPNRIVIEMLCNVTGKCCFVSFQRKLKRSKPFLFFTREKHKKKLNQPMGFLDSELA